MKTYFQILVILASFLTGCTSKPQANNVSPTDLRELDVDEIRPRLSILREGMNKQKVLETLDLWDNGPSSGSSHGLHYSYHLSNGQILSLSFSTYNISGNSDLYFMHAEIVTPRPIEN